MASSKSYLEYVLGQLSDLDEITYRPMMGEYLLYYHGVLFGGIYDNRLLVKRTKRNAQYNLTEVIPSPHAKPMYCLEDLDNREMLAIVVIKTASELVRD